MCVMCSHDSSCHDEDTGECHWEYKAGGRCPCQTGWYVVANPKLDGFRFATPTKKPLG